MQELTELDRLPDYQMFLINDHPSPTVKAMQAVEMKGVNGAKRTPNEAVIVVFKPRSAVVPGIVIEPT